MTTQFTIPASVEDAAEQLGGIDRLITASKWERAAIIATYVQVGEPRNRGGKLVNSDQFMTPHEFAALGIHGLTSHNTVRGYANTWLNNYPRPEPGQTVELPNTPYPVSDPKADNIARNPGAMAQAITNNPKVARQAAEAVAALATNDPDVAEAIDKPRQQLRDQVRERLTAAGLDDNKAAVSNILDHAKTPTWDDAQTAIREAELRAARVKDWERKRKAADADTASRPTWVLPILNIPVAMTTAGQRERDKLKGDPTGTRWDDDTRELLAAEIAQARAILDWVEALPDVDAITPEAIINGGGLA